MRARAWTSKSEHTSDWGNLFDFGFSPQPTSRLLRGALTWAMLHRTRRTATGKARGNGGLNGAGRLRRRPAAAARSGTTAEDVRDERTPVNVPPGAQR